MNEAEKKKAAEMKARAEGVVLLALVFKVAKSIGGHRPNTEDCFGDAEEFLQSAERHGVNLIKLFKE